MRTATDRRSGRVSRLWPALLAGVLVLASTTAWAHKFEPLREVIVQVDAAGPALLVRLSVRGAQATLLRATHDVNRDGDLSEAEGLQLAAGLAKKALRGLTARCDGAALEPLRIQPRLDAAVVGDELAVVVLAEYRWPATATSPAAAASYDVALALAPEHGEVEAVIQALPPFAPRARRARLSGGNTLALSVAVDSAAAGATGGTAPNIQGSAE